MDKEKKQQIALTILLSCGLLYVYWNYLYKPKMQQISEMKENIAVLERKLNVAKEKAKRLEQLQEEFELLQQAVQKIEKQLPRAQEIPVFLKMITDQKTRFGIHLQTISPQSNRFKEYFCEVPFAINGTAAYHNLASFLTSIGQQERIFNVRDLTLTALNEMIQNRSLQFSFILVSFMYQEVSQ